METIKNLKAMWANRTKKAGEEQQDPSIENQQPEVPKEQQDAKTLMESGNYYELLRLVLTNDLKDQFDVKDIASKVRPADLMALVDEFNVNVKDLLPEDIFNEYVEQLKTTGKVMKKKLQRDIPFVGTEMYKNTIRFAKYFGLDLEAYLRENYPSEMYTYPYLEQIKTKEDMQKLREMKITDTNHREFPYEIVPMRHQPGGRNSQGKYNFAFSIDSTDDIFPKEIFERLNKHNATGDKPVAFITGTYTPGEVLYVDEIQSDIIQRAQMYLQGQDEAKAKLEKRIDEIKIKYSDDPEQMPKEVEERLNKDERNLERIDGYFSSDFMPEYKQYRSKIQNYFSGWNIVAMNAILNFAQQHNIPTVFVRSADSLEKKWLSSYGAGDFTKDLYRRMYDDMVTEKYGAVREGDWWRINLKDVEEKIAEYSKSFVKQAGYEKLYEIYKPQPDNSVKTNLLDIPEIKRFVDKNLSEEEWNALEIAFWWHIPFYDEEKLAIYLPESIHEKLKRDEKGKMSDQEIEDDIYNMLKEEYEQEMGRPVSEEDADFFADEISGIKNDPLYYSDAKLTNHDMRMILHELSHYADHINRGEEFITETTGYYDNPERTHINLDKYRDTPAEKKSFVAEVEYLKEKGINDKDIVFEMKMQYGGNEQYWYDLVQSNSVEKTGQIKKARWSVYDRQTGRIMDTALNSETIEEAVNDMVEYMSVDFEDNDWEVVENMSIDERKELVEGNEFEFIEHDDMMESSTDEEMNTEFEREEEEKESMREVNEWEQRWHNR